MILSRKNMISIQLNFDRYWIILLFFLFIVNLSDVN